MNQLTKEQIIELGSNDMLAEALGLDYVSTTIGMNGYPECVKYAITSDSIKELNDTIEYLEKLGFEVDKFELHKKDGWGLWNRTSVWGFEVGQYQTVSDQDWYFDFNPEWSEEEAKKAIAEETTDIEEIVDALYEEMAYADNETRFFLDANNNYAIEYGVSKDSASYAYDTHNYQLSIMVTEFNLEDE